MTFQAGRATPRHRRGSLPLQLDGIGIDGRVDRRDASGRRVRRDGDDRGSRSAGASARATRRSSTASSSASARGVPGTRLSPIASAPARTAARTPSASVTPQIFTNGRRATLAGSSGGRPAATNDATAAAGRRSGPAPRRRARRRTRAPASARRSRRRGRRTRRRRADRPGRATRRRTARSMSTSSVRRSRLFRPMSRASVASAASSSRLVVGLDERLEPDLERPLDEPRQALRRVEHRQQQHEVRAGRARCGSWIASTTNSLARTGIATAARTARRSSTEPPNQCGSHRTEIAAAPPASYARARATMSSSACGDRARPMASAA